MPSQRPDPARALSIAALAAASAVPVLAAAVALAAIAGTIAVAFAWRGGALVALLAFVLIHAAARAATARGGASAAPAGAPLATPELAAVVLEEAAAWGVPAPDETLLSVDRDVRLVRHASRRILVIGAMAQAERAPARMRVAVGAALLHDGDDLGRRLRRLRAGKVARALAIAEEQPLASLPWRWGAGCATRLADAALRRRTLAIDAALAARHGEPLVSAELRAAGHRARFERFWGGFVAPCLRTGFRPPLAEGWHRALSLPTAGEELAAEVGALLETGAAAAGEPPLADRLAAAAATGAGIEPPASAPAWTAAGAQEAAILEARDPRQARQLVPVAWEQVADAVLLPWLRADLRDQEWLGQATVGELPDLIAAAPPEHPGEEADERAYALGCALLVALADAGWSVAVIPGENVRAETDEFTVEPFELAEDAMAGWLPAERWHAFAAEAGIDELSLAPPAPAEHPAPELEAIAALAPPAAVHIPLGGSRALRIRAALVVGPALALALPLLVLLVVGAFAPGMPAGGTAFMLAGAAALAGLVGVWAPSRLRLAWTRGSLVLDRDVLRIEHPALLRRPFELPRSLVCAAVLDDGPADRDPQGRVVRFPVADSVWDHPSSVRAGVRGWLWTDGWPAVVPYLGVQAETPNLALVFVRPVAGPDVRRETDHGPLRQEAVAGLLLATFAPPELRRSLTDLGFAPRLGREDVRRLLAGYEGSAPDPASV